MPPGTEARLQQLSITLPRSPAPGGNYISARTVGNIVFLSGVVSTDASGIVTWAVSGSRYEEAGMPMLTELLINRPQSTV